MIVKLALRVFALAAVLAAGIQTAVAQPAIPLPADGLIVTGRITGLESRWDASGTIVTDVEVAVSRRLRGQAPDRLVLKQLGGRVGEIGLFIAGQASFTVGEDALLLLAVDPRDGTLHTAGLGRGKLDADAATVAAVESALARGEATAYVAARAERDQTVAPAFAHLPTDAGAAAALARGGRRRPGVRRSSLEPSGRLDRFDGECDSRHQPVAQLRHGPRPA